MTRILPFLLILGLSLAVTRPPPDISDSQKSLDDILLQSKSPDENTGWMGLTELQSEIEQVTTHDNTNAPPSQQSKPEVKEAWVNRKKVSEECKTVINLIRRPKKVCGWEKQDVCKKVPFRKKMEKFVCDTNNYCHKVAYFKQCFKNDCKTVRKRVCKTWLQVKRVPKKQCVKKIKEFRCMKTESCISNRQCLKWLEKETNEGFQYRQCLRWIQYRQCGIKYTQCSLVNEQGVEKGDSPAQQPASTAPVTK